jgi:hypothetical protein
LRGFPLGGRVILHCTLLLKAAGQWKFALSGDASPGKGPKRAATAGCRSQKTSLVGA